MPAFAEVVADAIRAGAACDYTLHAWVVMPNHVHALLTPSTGETLSGIIHSWKSFTAHQMGRNKRLGRVWQDEYFDRIMRNDR